MGLLEKALGLAGAAAGGVAAAATGLLGNKKKKLAELDTEFVRTTQDYLAKKSKLESKINNGNLKAVKKLEFVEREYLVSKAEYENTRRTLLPSKSKIDEERDNKEFEQRLEIEKAKALHEMDMEKAKTIYGLEFEKDKSYHGWDLEKAESLHGMQMERSRTEHDMIMEKNKANHEMEMEKIELTSKLGVCLPDTNVNKSRDCVCSNCGNENITGSKFCSACGKTLSVQKFCTGCGASLKAGSRFCQMCGRAIDV